MTELRELLDQRKAADKPLPHGPRKGQPWGRAHRRLFREINTLPLPGPLYGEQLHYKNAAARKKYRVGLDALMASGATGDPLQYAIEDLQRKFCNRVLIYQGLHAKVRQELRSAMRREERQNATANDS